jgi:hypothetical protein
MRRGLGRTGAKGGTYFPPALQYRSRSCMAAAPLVRSDKASPLHQQQSRGRRGSHMLLSRAKYITACACCRGLPCVWS